MGTQREVHEYLIHPNEFKMLDRGEAVFVTKKPSDFGVVRVEIQEIEKVQGLHKLVGQVEEVGSAVKVLGLNKRLSVKKTEYISAFIKNSEPSPNLEI